MKPPPKVVNIISYHSQADLIFFAFTNPFIYLEVTLDQRKWHDEHTREILYARYERLTASFDVSHSAT